MYRVKHDGQRVRPRLVCGVSMTDASLEPETRVDRILYKYTHNIPLEQWQLKRAAGVYADVSEMPHDPAELRQYMEQKKEIWDELPAEIRREYDDNMYNMMAEAASNPKALAERVDKALLSRKAELSSVAKQQITKADITLVEKPIEVSEVKNASESNA